jgi:ribosomal protein S18 acetylase RimI-like enzyme
MTEKHTILIRETDSNDDSLIARHFYQLWRDTGVAEDRICDDWQTVVMNFLHQARQELSYKAFLAEVDGVVVGSSSCQLFAGLYPLVLTDRQRKYGYIWGVYVEATYRGRGIAKQLTQAAIAHLKTLGCTDAILHASPMGQPVYDRLGFVSSNEMRLDLSSF